MKITINELKQSAPYKGRWDEVIAELTPRPAPDEPFSVSRILEGGDFIDLMIILNQREEIEIPARAALDVAERTLAEWDLRHPQDIILHNLLRAARAALENPDKREALHSALDAFHDAERREAYYRNGVFIPAPYTIYHAALAIPHVLDARTSREKFFRDNNIDHVIYWCKETLKSAASAAAAAAPKDGKGTWAALWDREHQWGIAHLCELLDEQ